MNVVKKVEEDVRFMTGQCCHAILITNIETQGG